MILRYPRGWGTNFRTELSPRRVGDNRCEERMLEQGWRITVLPQEVKRKGKGLLVLFLLLLMQMAWDRWNFLCGIEPELFHCVLGAWGTGLEVGCLLPPSQGSILHLAFYTFLFGLFMRGDPCGPLPAQDILIQSQKPLTFFFVTVNILWSEGNHTVVSKNWSPHTFYWKNSFYRRFFFSKIIVKHELAARIQHCTEQRVAENPVITWLQWE